MPRIPHTTLLRAYNVSPLLPLVLRATRDLPSATRELRWLVEHIQEESKKKELKPAQSKKLLLKLCQRREKHEPLQYILGSQPFGPLDIECQRGVLIPRPETESIATYLAKLLVENKLHERLEYDGKKRSGGEHTYRVLDLCSGTGCISLLMASITAPHLHINTLGVDISPRAISLARKNLQSNIDIIQPLSTGHVKDSKNIASRYQFHQANVFEPQEYISQNITSTYQDIIICNPPYVSLSSFKKEVTRSVRNWEPKGALIPDAETSTKWPGVALEDVFYRQLLEFQAPRTDHDTLHCSVLVMECGDAAQVERVVAMTFELYGDNKCVEVWRDDLGSEPPSSSCWIALRQVRVVGMGKPRAVIVFDLDWARENPEKLISNTLACRQPTKTVEGLRLLLKEPLKYPLLTMMHENLKIFTNTKKSQRKARRKGCKNMSKKQLEDAGVVDTDEQGKFLEYFHLIGTSGFRFLHSMS